MRSTERLTGFSKKAVTRLQREIGDACADFHDRTVRNVKCKRAQVDEVWSFTYSKQKNIPAKLMGKEHCRVSFDSSTLTRKAALITPVV